MTATTTEFTYTDYAEPSSSAVCCVYYNSQTSELVVELLSGDAYRYIGVSPRDFDLFKTPGVSAGVHYATRIKRTYGPGIYEGYEPQYEEASYEAPSMDGYVPKNLTYAKDAEVNTASGAVFNLYSGGAGTIKADVTTPRFGLTVDKDESPATLRHEVFFTIGDSDEKSYTLDAVDVDEAVNKLTEVAEALGVSFNVKAVKVYFE